MASIRKLPSGSFRAEIARKGQRTSKVFESRQAAKDWAARQEFLILEAAEAPVDHGNFGDLLKRYGEEVSPTKRSERWEAARLAKFREDSLGKVRLADLKASDFADWRDRRLKAVAPGTVIRELQLMSAALNRARKEWGIVTTNPVADIVKPAKPPARDRLPTPDEMERLAYAAGSDLSTATARSFHAFKFGIETAMRAGEIVGLTWDRIDMARRVARLDHTKNGRPRDVPLSSEAIRLLEALPKLDPVFGLDNRLLDALWRKVRNKAKADGLNFHDSRHAAITRLSKKLDVLALARMVGHSDLRMLQVYYNETAEELARRLD